MSALNLTYYGHVFDGSGYGQAARAYVHALHRAGVRLSVVDLMNHGRQVNDELIESLLDRPLEPDFHLFHGIPAQWARRAFRLPNAIGMTVWETDTMPVQWRNVLSHVLEVWLPCEFNVATFRRDLSTPLFKWPHPIVPPVTNGNGHAILDPDAFLGTRPTDFVFYSAFEWQERKCPTETIQVFLDALSGEDDAVLVLKTNPAAAEIATRTVDEARRRRPSQARVIVRTEAWSDVQMEALHQRGDCYVSLHRGEGWGYPLFEASCRGKPVIATAYSAPLEYLGPECNLVSYTLVPVRQSYPYYRPSMRWAEPNLAEAAERMRWIHANRRVAQQRSAEVAQRLQRTYSLEAVGRMAADRLHRLLERTQPRRCEALERRARMERHRPPVPIPAEWYDEDYFEKGAKSNWTNGYAWESFDRLFRATAQYIAGCFAEATSFLDVGCAKGFLVRTLRDLGKECWGIDHSAWALDRAADSVKPFLAQAGVDDFLPDRTFDVVLAFDLLPHLTEEQAERFLRRARAWTHTAILATIACDDAAADTRRGDAVDCDLAHITMQPQAFWHALFLRAGWQQDALHRVAARACQEHELPRKMGWRVFVYAPGPGGAA